MVNHISLVAQGAPNSFVRRVQEDPGIAVDLLSSLEEVTRILEAFSYTTQLGKSQRERLERAKALIAKANG